MSLYVGSLEVKDPKADVCDGQLFKTLELKQTLLSARQNQVMIVFTVITIIFVCVRLHTTALRILTPRSSYRSVSSAPSSA